MTLSVRAIATLGLGFGARAVAYLGLWPVGNAPAPIVEPHRTRALRSRTNKRIPKRYVEREIQTPDGPMIVLVPDDWTADDLMTLTTALVLTDALH